MIKPKADFLIESAYEVVNPIGGLYTVLTTKAAEMVKYYGDNYYAMGPYYSRYAKVDFEETEAPPDLVTAFDELKDKGIICHYGRWLLPSRPKAILVDFKGRMKDLKDIKARIFEEYGVVSDKCGKEYNKRFVLSDSVSKVIERLLKTQTFKGNGVLHQHISGSPGIALLDAKKNKWKIGLVATAHSTRLGRDIAMSNEDLVEEIRTQLKKDKHVDHKREYNYGGETVTEHQLERACAKASDVFTAVSDITSRECGYILERKADVVLPNGINCEKYPTIEERALLHKKSKEKIWRFLEAYFLPYYPIDVGNSLLLFTSGRYEFHNKGFDTLIHSLGWLNKILKEEGYPKNIFVFFFIFDRGVRKYNYELLENLSKYEHIESFVDENIQDIEKRAISMLVHGDELDKKELFDKEFIMEGKKLMNKFKKPEHRRPPICALRMGRNDVICNTLNHEDLLNREEDKIKVIVYPTRITVDDGLLSMPYYDVMAGMHLGVFPSYYEPWGYTPLEAAAYSVMSITTDLAGFGKFVQKNTDQRKKPGIIVLKRDGRTHEQEVIELKNALHWFSGLERSKRVEKKINAKEISQLADWKDFAEYYIEAHNMALQKSKGREPVIKAEQDS